MASLNSDLLQIEPVRRSTLSNRVYDRLLESIITGKISPGQHLVEQILAEHLGVSRISVREAIRSLAQHGLVEIVPNRGAFVIGLSIEDILEIYQLRASLEGLGVQLATQKLNDDVLQELDKILQKMEELEQTNDRLHGASVDTQFHRIIMNFSGNRRAIRVWEQMSSQIRMVVYNISNYYPHYSGLVERHYKLIEIMKSGDAETASGYVQSHIMEGAQHVLEAMEQAA